MIIKPTPARPRLWPRVTFLSDPELPPSRHTVVEVNKSRTHVRIRTTRRDLAPEAPRHLNEAIEKNLSRGHWAMTDTGLYIPGADPEPTSPPPITFVRDVCDDHRPVLILDGKYELLVVIDMNLIRDDEACEHMTIAARENIAERWQRLGSAGLTTTSA